MNGVSSLQIYTVLINIASSKISSLAFTDGEIPCYSCEDSIILIPMFLIVSLAATKLWELFYLISWSISTLKMNFKKNENEIMRLRGRAHCMIEMYVAAFLLKLFFLNRLVSNSFTAHDKSSWRESKSVVFTR